MKRSDCGVDAVAQAGRTRAVLEDVAQVRIAVLRAHFDAPHAVADVGVIDDMLGFDRLREARPTGARLELVERAEQRLAADDVDVQAGLVVVPKFVAEGRLGGVVLRHFVLERAELRAQLSGRRFGVGTLSHSL